MEAGIKSNQLRSLTVVRFDGDTHHFDGLQGGAIFQSTIIEI
jgi:hypothetical protein